jgi:signal peptidase II
VSKKYWIFLATLFILLAVDQWLKIYIKTSFEPNQIKYLFGNWFALHYIENQGMAFGTTLGASVYAKLALSLFRIAAIVGIAYYIVKQIKKNVALPHLMALTLILAGATGNLIDSMVYDYLFPFNPCDSYNQLEGSGVKMNCNQFGISFPVEVRNKGFLFGNVVDMFQFDAYWPSWMPWVGGKPVFPAIWNVADTCISVGVGLMIIIHRKSLFSFKKQANPEA